MFGSNKFFINSIYDETGNSWLNSIYNPSCTYYRLQCHRALYHTHCVPMAFISLFKFKSSSELWPHSALRTEYSLLSSAQQQHSAVGLPEQSGLSLRSSNKSQLAMERVYGPNCTEQRRSSATLVCDCSQQHAAWCAWLYSARSAHQKNNFITMHE